jgi:protein phosphatase
VAVARRPQSDHRRIGDIRLTCFGKTDVGRRRELNEDTFYYSDKDGFAVVADGMGGRDFGEVASSLCVSTLNKSFKKYFPETLRGHAMRDDEIIANVVRQTLDTWVRDMNVVVYEFGSLDHRYREMGTTLALVFHQEDYIAVAHVGDSRVYRVRDGRIEQITEDHSFVNAQLRAGLITEEEALHSQHKNIITRAIGTRAAVKADVAVHPAEAGDIYLLCSDGLSDLVEGHEMLATLYDEGMDLERGVQALIDLANARGGKDNITVVLGRLDADGDE